jgi:hypothetical protein
MRRVSRKRVPTPRLVADVNSTATISGTASRKFSACAITSKTRSTEAATRREVSIRPMTPV